ncbi:hypothetical protein [Geomobilimonas luticola]|uniref:Uncharacterized protein n=1 Tax=Geomobilimonas luticola TaxID=1114878 RepID=A0ABS5SD15_9BACT|nr:hypothetical protein [Geomobilimonas luticola]MBT0653271.1 hypothetical protein [Geomobilimonas luticola]
MLNDVGAEVYETWSYEQRHEEIGKLVEGYRNGLPLEILCMMTTSIAGSEKLAREHLIALVPPDERQAIIAAAKGNKKARSRVASFFA